MYAKLFQKILDSSIWMEPDATRIVWVTLLAAMNSDGFCQFASVANVAHRARVSVESAAAAIQCLENPDKNSSDPENRGKRIERVPGGWIVLNAHKYRDLVSKEVEREQTRARVAKYREKKRKGVTCNAGNADETVANAKKRHAERDTDADKEGEGKPSLAEFVAIVEALKPGIPNHFIRAKYFAKLEKCDGWIRNPKFFAAQVVSWHDGNAADKAPPPTRPPNYKTQLERDLDALQNGN